MAYIKANAGSASGGTSVFPKPGYCYSANDARDGVWYSHDIAQTPSFTESQADSMIGGIQFVANVKDTGYTQFVTSNFRGAYSGVAYFDEEGNELTGGGRFGCNGTFTLPADTVFILWSTNNYNQSGSRVCTIAFS